MRKRRTNKPPLARCKILHCGPAYRHSLGRISEDGGHLLARLQVVYQVYREWFGFEVYLVRERATLGGEKWTVTRLEDSDTFAKPEMPLADKVVKSIRDAIERALETRNGRQMFKRIYRIYHLTDFLQPSDVWSEPAGFRASASMPDTRHRPCRRCGGYAAWRNEVDGYVCLQCGREAVTKEATHVG